MASTLTRILIHTTYSTKNRAAMIPEALEADLYSYVGGICRGLESPLLAMNGTADHVHMLVSQSKKIAISDLWMEVKRDSSKWIKRRDAALGEFAWQDGFFGLSIGASGEDALRAYIAGQKQHHKTIDFKDEVRAFLRKYGVEWDERYIWE